MSYYIAARIDAPFEDVLSRARDALSKEGFGIITEIDIASTLKEKLGADFRPYRILGACNPALAHEALEIEDKVGTMLPCNVVVQELKPGTVEVAAVDPVSSMQAIDNPQLRAKASEVRDKLDSAISRLRTPASTA